MDKKKTAPPPAPGQEIEGQQPALDLLIGEKDSPESSSVDRKVFEALLADMKRLAGRVIELENGLNENPDHCTCPNSEFVCVDATAHVEAAEMYLKTARGKANKDKEAIEERKGKILLAVSNLIADSSYLTRNKMRGENDSQISKNIHTLTESLTDEIMELREPSTKDIAELLSAKRHYLRELGYNDIVTERPEEFEKLIRACSAHSAIKTYLKKLTSDAMDMSILNVPKVWREKWDKSLEGTPEGEKQRAIFEELADKANDYCRVFFGEEGLHPEVKNQNDIKELLTIVKNTLPDSPEKYSLLASAVAKLNIMHLVDYIETKIDANRLKTANEHLTKKLKAHQKTKPGEPAELFCSRDGNPDNYISIHDVDIPDPKQRFSIARKFITRDLQFTRDFRLEDIKDLLRFSIILTEEDSESQKKIDKAVEKVVGILLAIFGTDISEGRLRYSFNTGSTNGHSTGKHRAFHFTFWYRAQCESFGKDESGETRHDMIPIEVQIRPFMFKEEVQEDHKVYDDRKDAKIRKYMGMDTQYPEFIRNLCEAILYCDDYPDKAKRNIHYGFERPMKEKWVMTIVSMLNKRTSTGTLANEYTIRKIFENPKLIEKVRRVLNIYAKAESGIVRQHAGDIEEMRGESKPSLVRRFVKLLEREKMLNKTASVNHQEGNPTLIKPLKYDPEKDLEKINQMSNEEIIAEMMAMNGGWRLNLYNSMDESETHPFVESGLNTLAKRGLDVLDEYEQKLNKPKS